jgi:rod shape-determining protein MreC
VKVKQYFYKYGVKVAVIVVVVALIALIGAGVRSGVAGPLGNGAGALKMPVQKAASAVVDYMESLYGYLYKYDRLVEENNSLRAQLAELQEQARSYDEVNEENSRLRQLLDLREKRADFVYESAKIVSWDSSNYASAFTISKGSDDGLEVGDSVITEYGALVGQVTELGSNWATVRTIIDVNMDVGALVGDNGYAGMVEGEFTLMKQGLTRMAYLSSGAQIFQGDEVLTSGKGGSFPSGLLIGTVTAVMTEAGGQTTYGVVEPACQLDGLSQVFVIVDYDIVE